MAVSLDQTMGNVWKITGTTTAATTLYTGPVWISKVVWRNPTTSNHDLDIVDSLGAVIVDYDAVAIGDAGDMEWTSFSESGYNGIVVNTMDSGTVYIHIS